MLFFFHLLCGVIAGTILIYYTKCNANYIMPTCILAAIISDLIDKPFMLTNSTLSSGRIIGHSIIFAVAICIIVALINKDRLLAIASGFLVFTHQFFDSMWLMPTSWFYPFMGSFLSVIPDDPNWLHTMIVRELTSLFGWLCVFLIFMIFLAYYDTSTRGEKCTT